MKNEAPKRICIFSLTYYPRPIGGAEVAIKEITDRIDPENIQFDLIALRFDSTLPKVEQVGNVCVHRIGFTKKDPSATDLVSFPLKFNKVLFPFLAFFKARSLHRTKKYDAIWAMMANFSGFATVLFKMTHPRVPYLLTLQEGDPIEYILRKVRFVRPLFNRIFTRADAVQAISHYLASWAREMGHEGNVEVIPNAVNTEHFSREFSPKERADMDDELGKKEGDVFLITASRLVKKNAVDDVITSLADLPEHIHFAVLGTGPDEEKLRMLAREKDVIHRVHFLGHVSHEEMPKYFAAADIFIRPSRSEGMGNAFIEAMAAELPVIATSVGGISDFLTDYKTGRVVPPDEPKAIANVVQWYLDNPENRSEIVQNARELVFAEYDWDKIARDMQERVFMPLLDSTPETQ